MSPLDVLQMLGRAGRPGYDDVGYGWVICDRSEADRYRQLLREGKEIESRLAEDLDAHLNAEIAMGTIESLEDVMAWLETTFYYVRARSQPAEYEFETLRERVREKLDSLVERGFIEVGEDLSVETSSLGVLASKYYLRLETAARFYNLATREEITDEAILETISQASEFDSVSARQSEREAINAALGNRGNTLEAGERKVLSILRGAMTGTTPSELSGDAWVIRQNALRLLAALQAFCDRFADLRATNRISRIEGRVEYGVSDDAVGLTAISGIGPGRASKLASKDLTSPGDVRDVGVEGLVTAGLTESVAERVIENAGGLPAVSVDWGAFPEEIALGENEICEVEIESTAGGANAAVRITVNDVEMTESETFLGSMTVPVGVFGGNAEELTYTVEVVFPDLPLQPVVESRSVRVV